MRKLKVTALLVFMGLSLISAPASRATGEITKPSAPTVVSVSSSTPKKGKVNVTVTIALPTSNGGSKITGSKISAGGKSCTIKKLKTSCVIKGLKSGKTISVVALSKNKKGFGAKSSPFVYATPTVTQANAIRMAQSYLKYSSFSRSGLIAQLEYEGFSSDVAAYGVDANSVDWKQQAVKMAKSYLDYSAFSRSGLIAQLEYEGFSSEDATFGVDQNGL
jgi:hypothetical protein